ncbi:MAG: hypothetical protein WBB82_16380 [Limnothrix sp.]
MPKSLRYRQKLVIPAGLQKTLRVSSQKIGAASRSVDWLRLTKLTGMSGAIAALCVWQWQLVVATAIGAGVMGTIYTAYDLPWEKYLEEFYRFWQGEYRRLGVAVLGGASAVVASYGAIALWQSVENHWLVTVVGIQIVMVGAILLISLRQTWGQSSELAQFETALDNLGHQSSVKRLAAIRYLRRLLQTQKLDPSQKSTLYTFLRLAWQQEPESALRGALLSTLSFYKGSESATAFQPLNLKKSRPPIRLEQKIHQRIEERV